MICPHCAFPNEGDNGPCVKCRRSLQAQPEDAAINRPLPDNEPVSGPRQWREQVALARRQESEGDFRSAFLSCQDLLLDHADELESGLLAEAYSLMGRTSQAQGKLERAVKYFAKARALNPEAEEAQASDEGGLWGAGLWVRLAALALDGLVVSAVLTTMLVVVSLIMGQGFFGALEPLAEKISRVVVFAAIVGGLFLIYLTLFARWGGQTPGKMILKLKVVALDGGALSTALVIRRALGMVLAGLPGLAGLLWAGFDLNRRGWHDRLSDSLVIRTQGLSSPAVAERQAEAGPR